MKYSIFILLLLFPWWLISQEPHHIAFDMESGAPTNTFYSVIEGNDGYLYLGSDMGMYRFNGMEFFHLTNDELGTLDVTRLKKDEKGNIWGMTFKNHLVRVSGDSLETVLKWHHAKNFFMDYSIENSNSIWLSSENDSLYKYTIIEKKIIGYSTSKTKTTIKHSKPPSNIIENRVYFPSYEHKKEIHFLQLNNNYSLGKISTTILKNIHYSRLRFIKRKNKEKFLYFPDIFPGKGKYLNIYQIQNDSVIPPPEWLRLSERISHISLLNERFLISTSRGLLIRSENKQEHWLKGIYCSEARYINRKGLWVSTIGKGLIYFPNITYSSLNDNLLFDSPNITQIKAIDEKIYLGTSTGKFLSYEPSSKEFESIWKSQEEYQIEYLYLNTDKKEISFGNLEEVIIYNIEKNKISNSKSTGGNTFFWDSIGILLGASGSLLDFSESDSLSPLIPKYLRKEGIGKNKYSVISNTQGRNPIQIIITTDRPYSAIINRQDTTFWVSTRNQLIHFKRNRIDTITYNNKPIISTKIEMADDGSIWAATSTGVLRIKDDNVVLKLDKSNALKYENITTLRVHEENVYLISNEGFQQYNTRSKKLKFYNELDGLPRGKVNDVEKLGGHIYVGMDRGLIRIPMEEDAINNLIPIAIISEVFVNEVSLNTVKDRIGLAYYENNIRIDISAIALRSLGQYTYQYRLKGIDEGWLTISSSNKSIRFPKLSDGSYKFQVKVLNDDGIESEVQSLEIRISPPFWKTWWFITSSIFGLGFITALIVYLRFQIINKQLRLEKALKNSEMKAIRAQMNPHFVFNALNSIQSLVLQKDYKNSNYYLGKFSNLVRIILMMSEQQKVTLQEEIEMLRLYLDLEKLRFDDINIKLVVEIETHEQEELVVPPMLTQPHVENALKHGLLHKKKGKKHISIRFSLLGDYVKIIIQDNGVGRKQRKKMQERSLKRHKSYSTEANIKRVELLNQNRQKKIITSIEDADTSILDTGTKVVLLFPIEYDF